MLTILAVPKAFTDNFRQIQMNAISSWKMISSDIILFGNDKGVAEIAKKQHLRYIPHVVTNDLGTPLLSDIFSKGIKHARFSTIAYINCDVIVGSDLLGVLQHISFSQFLMIGRRRNVKLRSTFHITRDWQQKIQQVVKKQKRDKPLGDSSEIFVFPKKVDFRIPPFAVGRLYWDSWLIYKAKCMHLPVVDVTESVTYFHQIHDYSHHPQGKNGVWFGEEAEINFQLAGGNKSRFKVSDADWMLASKGLEKKPPTVRGFVRNLRVWGLVYPQFKVILYPLYIVGMVIFKAVMLGKVLLHRGPASIIDTLKAPHLLEYKLKEL